MIMTSPRLGLNVKGFPGVLIFPDVFVMSKARAQADYRHTVASYARQPSAHQ